MCQLVGKRRQGMNKVKKGMEVKQQREEKTRKKTTKRCGAWDNLNKWAGICNSS